MVAFTIKPANPNVMKPKHLSLLNLLTCTLLIAVLLASASVQSYAQTKRGLIVAIGDYTGTEWRQISSANDIPLIRSALQKQGFQSNNIQILQDSAATKSNIVKSFEDLIDQSSKGDIVVVHFSSHGQQVEDDNNDELDGYDEAIVAYGAPAKYKEGYDFSKHLRDDELEVLLNRLRAKVGPAGDVMVLVDACHSGTVGRNKGVPRGGMPAYQHPGYVPAKGKADVGVFQKTENPKFDPSQLAPLVIISASQASEVNYEYEGAGSLSTAVSRSVDKLNAEMSYRAFFSQILKEMSIIAPSQKPAIEGDIDRTLFGGHVVEQEPFYKAYKIRDNQVYLYGGKLNGIFKDTKIAVFPIGTTTTSGKTPITTGTALFSEGTWCKVQLEKMLEGAPEDYWFFVTERSVGDIQLYLEIDIRDNDLRKRLTESLSQSALFLLSDEDPDFILEDGGRGTIDIIRASDNKVFAENLSSDENFKEVLQTLKQFSQGTYMKNLELSDPRFQVVFELIPVRVDEEGVITDTLSLDEMSENGIMIFTESIAALVKVKNIGEQDAYFSIIDIQPDGKINGILPADDPEMHQNPEDFFIKAGHSFIVSESVVYFGAPYGMEVFKLFASKEPIDFTPIITKKPRSRSVMTGLEVLFEDGYNDATRGGTTKKIKSTGMESSTAYISFEIRQ